MTEQELQRQKDHEEDLAPAILMSIKNLMTTLKLTKQQAMDALLIPLGEQSKYLAKL